jgi:primosomal protein N'
MFFEEETELRKALRYPPFGTLIAFHVEGGRKRLLEAKIALIEAVMPHAPVVLPERHLEKSTYRMTILLHVGKGEWPEEELSARLQALPPYVRVSIDPETFW